MKKIRWHFVLFWVMLFAFWYAWPTEGAEVITLKVTPKVQIAPLSKRGAVRAMWRIEPDERNVYYSFAYSGPEEGSTLKKMDEFSPAHYERLIELPPGHYVFQACVVKDVRPKPTTHCATDQVEVR